MSCKLSKIWNTDEAIYNDTPIVGIKQEGNITSVKDMKQFMHAKYMYHIREFNNDIQ